MLDVVGGVVLTGFWWGNLRVQRPDLRADGIT